jgi:hypothetical protein
MSKRQGRTAALIVKIAAFRRRGAGPVAGRGKRSDLPGSYSERIRALADVVEQIDKIELSLIRMSDRLRNSNPDAPHSEAAP